MLAGQLRSSGGCQAAWQAALLEMTGRLLASSKSLGACSELWLPAGIELVFKQMFFSLESFTVIKHSTPSLKPAQALGQMQRSRSQVPV